MFGLKVNRMPLTINLPLTSPIGQYPNDIGGNQDAHGAYQRAQGELVQSYSTG